MGNGGFDSKAYESYSRSAASKPVSGSTGVFKSATLDDYLDPKDIKWRESRDSDANPRSTPIMILSDVTGSMGALAKIIVLDMGNIVGEIYDTKPVTDPHILLGAIGDADMRDTAPLQVTQFEAENAKIVAQIEKIFVEGGGGGNRFESYHLAWLFAAMKTVSDANEKRNEKGFLFTIGDEYLARKCTLASVEKVFGNTLGLQDDMDVVDVLAMAQRKYHVFHLIVADERGQFYDGTKDGAGMLHDHNNANYQGWDVMGENALLVKDYHAISDVIVGTIRALAGHSMDDILKGRSDSRAMVVADAIKNLPTVGKNDPGTGLVTY